MDHYEEEDLIVDPTIEHICYVFSCRHKHKRGRVKPRVLCITPYVFERFRLREINFGGAHYIVKFVRDNQALLDCVIIENLVYKSAGVVSVLKDGLASVPHVKLHIVMDFVKGDIHLSNDELFTSSRSQIQATAELAQVLSVVLHGNETMNHNISFEDLVECILCGNGKRQMKQFNLGTYVPCTSASLKELVQKSNLETLCLSSMVSGENVALNLSPLWDTLKTSTSPLKKLSITCESFSTERQVEAIVDKFESVLIGTTTLTHVGVNDMDGELWDGPKTHYKAIEYFKQKVQPLIQRNMQLEQANEAIQIPFASCSEFWQHMRQQKMTNGTAPFTDDPDLSALYLSLRNVLVGQRGEAQPLVVTLATRLSTKAKIAATYPTKKRRSMSAYS